MLRGCQRHFAYIQIHGDPTHLATLVRRGGIDVLLLDMNFAPGADSGTEGLMRLSEILEIDPQAVVVMITAHGDVELAVEAMKKGAADFVTKPWENERLVATFDGGDESAACQTGCCRTAPAQSRAGGGHSLQIPA